MNTFLTELENAISDVSEINERISDVAENVEEANLFRLQLETDGYNFGIRWMDFQLYSSNDEDREFSEEKNEYEPFIPFLLRKMIEISTGSTMAVQRVRELIASEI